MKAKVNKLTIEVIQADLLNLTVDAVVVVTDPNLTVSETLKQTAGPNVESEARAIGWADVGTAAITSAGNHPSIGRIIHAVGPRWGEGAERGKLATVTWECLRVAEENQLKSLAFPAISVGTLGYPVEACASIMISRIIDYTFEQTRHLRHILLALPDTPQTDVFNEEFERQIRDLRESGEGKVRV